MKTTISADDLRPFLAPVLLEAATADRDGKLLRKVMIQAEEQSKSSATTIRKSIHSTAVIEESGLRVQAHIYSESRPPSWLDAPSLIDLSHQIIVVAVRGKNIAICASDAAMRDRLVRKIKFARKMQRGVIAKFVGEEARAIWLNGVHTPSAAKPDTKAMTGTTLEYALDPIGDQTYYYSAARTAPKVAGFLDANSRQMMIGAAPAAARIWVGRSEDISAFAAQVALIFDHVEHGKAAPDPFSSLAQSVSNATGIRDAYGIAIVPEELLSEDEVSSDQRTRARDWAYDTTYEVVAGVGLNFTVRPVYRGEPLGLADMHVALVDGVATLDCVWQHQESGKEELCGECETFMCDANTVKIYYETGHAIAQGRCYSGGFTDQPFSWTFASFAGYEVNREKPDVPKGSKLADHIGQPKDTSLFGYVCHRMFLDKAGVPSGWLASDDGSMELADFIHVDPTEHIVTLVHIKASGKSEASRQAAPAEYEVVASQAVKNLRHLDRRKLHEELKRGKGKKIGAAVWHNGVKQKDRDQFLEVVAKLPASTRKVLMIIQPRLTRTEYEFSMGAKAAAGRSMRVKQMNTLMLAARASALACGAEFQALADDV